MLSDILKSKGLTVSTAESCTGGLIAGKITAESGSSSFFLGGAVTYSNESKVSVLGVSEEILIANGAVSKETAIAMAEGSRRIFKSDIAVAVTGIAGPGGAVEGKPVGTVHVACVSKYETIHEACLFEGDRNNVRQSTVEKALELIEQMTSRFP